MSEGDVSLIRDEDVLRRMWQQTEDFSRKKEIRTHMYRLREERLRDLYSPEPGAEAKGCEFTSSQGHVKSFADQNFQSMKSKEVRDAGSPPKDFTYHGQDLKELSNAGWNVESENRTTDDGHTHIKSVHANIEGRYDVNGGHGQFAAVDHNKQAVTEYDDGNTSLRRNENVSSNEAHEQVVRKIDDATHFSSTKSSSSSSSKFEQTSSKCEQVPYETIDDLNISPHKIYDNNRYDIKQNEETTSNRFTKTSNYEQNIRNDNGELVSRKIDYPDENTKVIIETRCLPNGTMVTSTRREFRAPAVQTSRKEHQTKSESKSSSYTSSQTRSHVNESTSKLVRETIDDKNRNIVDSQKIIDDYDYQKKCFSINSNDDYERDANEQYKNQSKYEKIDTKATEKDVYSSHNDEYIQRTDINATNSVKNVEKRTDYVVNKSQGANKVEERSHSTNIPKSVKDVQDTYITSNKAETIKMEDQTNYDSNRNQKVNEIEERNKKVIHENVVVEKKSSSNEHHQSTYQTDYTQRKISNDWSPAHQAWASTLRSDTPTRPSTRASSPGSKTFKSSTSSLRSSVSPDKTNRKPSSRCVSPNKADRTSPIRTFSEKYSNTHSSSSVTEKRNKFTSPERHSPDSYRERTSTSPEKPLQSRSSPDKTRNMSKPDDHRRPKSPTKSTSPQRSRLNNEPLTQMQAPHWSETKKPELDTIEDSFFTHIGRNLSPNKTNPADETQRKPSLSPDRKSQKPSTPTKSATEPIQRQYKGPSPAKLIPQNPTEDQPGYMRPTESRKPKSSNDPGHLRITSESLNSHDRNIYENTVNKENIKEDHYKFIDEETKMYLVNDNCRTTTTTHISSENQFQESSDGNQFLKEQTPSPEKQTEYDSLSRKTPVKDIPAYENIPKQNIDTRRSQVSPSKEVNEKPKSSESPAVTPTIPKGSRLQSKSPSPTRKRPTDFKTLPLTDIGSLKRKSQSPEKSPTRPDSKSFFAYSETERDEIKNTDLHGKQRSDTPENKDVVSKRKPSGTFKEPSRDATPENKTFTKDKVSPDRNQSPSNQQRSLHSRTPSPTKNTSLTTKVHSVDINDVSSKKVETSNINTGASIKQKEDSERPKMQSRKTVQNKSPRNSCSPVKITQAKDFIEIEKNTEELNKSTLHQRPRKLITPSTSPTRKPKETENAPLSGQSSPTTSVSGFEYFSSHSDERAVTDLDEQLHTETKEYSKTIQRNSMDVNNRITSSSKIPCRSPSPEKRPTKETLPRKSSLKKPSIQQISPTEKPPSSFIISPNVETKEIVDHKVVIQDPPVRENDKPTKTKPPFERRETYEERCRKILGMVDTDKSESPTKDIPKDSSKDRSNMSSPSVSPCRSPSSERQSSFDENVKNTYILQNKEVLSHEIEGTKKTVSLKNISDSQKTSKIPTREASPTKLLDITSMSEDTYCKENKLNIEKNKSELIKSTVISSKQSNENRPSDKTYPMPKYSRSSISPEKKLKYEKEVTSHNVTNSNQVDELDNHLQTQEKHKTITSTEISKNQPTKPVVTPEHKSKKIIDGEINDSRTTNSRSSLPMKNETNPRVGVVSSEYEILHTTECMIDDNIIDTVIDEVHYAKSKSPISPERQVPAKISSPIKHVDIIQPHTNIMNETSNLNIDFITSEKEKEVLDRVQKSLRKLSPQRKEISSTSDKKTRDKSPLASNNSTEIEIISADNTSDTATTNTTTKSTKKITNEDVTHEEKQKHNKDKKTYNKPPTRTVSPTKKPSNGSPVPARSISPKKPSSPVERPQSPHILKSSGIKPKEQVTSHIRKPSPSPVPTTKSTLSVNKQSNVKSVTNKFSSVKTVPTNVPTSNNKYPDQETKRVIHSKTAKDTIRKDADTKVSRTVSDLTIKSKKALPQRIKSKPEIQVNDVTTARLPKHSAMSNKTQKLSSKEPQTKLPTSKPKSATALNTSLDEDDVIIDVQQAKSSRENSPDRICPTPVGFSEDIGTPRFPDEVNEPDDEYQKRTYKIIHETESIVDDIIEISEDDELFVKRNDTERENEILNVNDKETKFITKVENVSETKDTTSQFKKIEKQVHSDFIDENLKSDDCLLSVSEKVHKFAKGTIQTKDGKSPSRNIIEEYDKHTTYQDDFTKLSVNDKAHLFIETAENVKTTQSKSSHKFERPNLSEIDDTLKSDDCLLSVSDKVNKFVRTAEQFLNESYEIEEKEKKIKEQHEKIMKKILDVHIDDRVVNTDNGDNILEVTETKSKKRSEDEKKQNSFAKETAASNAKAKDHISPNLKPTQKSTVKITALRSSDAVKKAKALFENIASTTTQKTNEISNSKSPKQIHKPSTKKAPSTDAVNIIMSETTKTSETVIKPTTTTKQDVLNDTLIELKESVTNQKDKLRNSPVYLRPHSPERVKSKSPTRLSTETHTTTSHIQTSSDLLRHGEHEQNKLPGYQRPTKTSQIKEECKVIEDTEIISTRRGSGKFGVELRRMSNERSTPTSERRRSSVEHHQPCIEDIFDLDLLEQMLEKVVGYEQRRRIRAQIRVAKKRIETEQIDTHSFVKTNHSITRTNKLRSPDRHHKSPERPIKVAQQKTESPDRHHKSPERPTKVSQQKTESPDRHHKSPERPTKVVPRKTESPDRHHKSPERPTKVSQQKTESPDRHHKSPERPRKVVPQKTESPDRHHKSSERPTKVAPQKTEFPDRQTKTTSHKSSSPQPNVKSSPQIILPSKPSAPIEQNNYLLNGDGKETHKNYIPNVRPHSPAKLTTKISNKTKSPVRQHSPEKKFRPLSPTKNGSTKVASKSSRFNEYASAYMKKVGLKDNDKITDLKMKKAVEEQKAKTIETHLTLETKFSSSSCKNISERTRSKDKIETTKTNVTRSPSPEQKLNNKQNEQEKIMLGRRSSPTRKPQSPERITRSPERQQHSMARSPSPQFDRQKSDTSKSQIKKETIIKTVYDIEKKIPTTPKQEEKPSWVTNRNLKKSSEVRTFTTKKVEPEKTRYRPVSPSKVISKPIDVITSSYGPGPLDADGRPLFGIKALRNGSSNYQVKGTVIRQEFHSRNGGEPEGTVSVTAYSTEPEDLEKLLQAQGDKPSRLHGLAAITTTKKFGGDTGATLSQVHNREERVALEQFTHSDRKVTESRITSNKFDKTDEFIQNEKLESENSGYVHRDRVQIIEEDAYEKPKSKQIKSEKESTNKQNQKIKSEKEKKLEMERRGRDRIDKSEKREDKKTVRQSSVKSLTEKYIKSASETAKSERHVVYPKAGLILRTSTMKDSVSSDSSAHAGLTRTDSEQSLGSNEEVVTTTSTEQTDDGVKTTTTTTTRCSGHTRATERSFLDSNTKVTGVQDILTRMKNADIVIEEGDTNEDTEARALLNKFLGATVLMAGMQSYVTEKPTGKLVIKQETVESSGGKTTSSRRVEELDIDQCWDERVLRKLLDECSDYEQRRRLRARIRTLMAEQEACASAVTEALAAAGESVDTEDQSGEREEEEVTTTVTSSVRRNSSEKTVSSSCTTIKNSKVIESLSRPAPKPVSPFAKFRQLEKQNSTNSPNSPKSPQSPGSPSQPYFKFTDPALQASAVTIKERLLMWCRDKTREYENVKLENFSTSWADGLAFCALVHHFLPHTFDYSKLTPERRRHNFTLAFKVADEKAGIYPLLDVDDMVAMRKPDWKCVFTYVQSIYRRFKDEQ